MKSIKIFLSFTICMLFVFIMPKIARAAEWGNYSYDIVNGKAVITKFNSSGYIPNGLVTIPETLGGHRVSSIGKSAFANCGDIKKVIIPRGVKSIGDYAFSGCRYLSSVEIPKSVTSIGDFSFANCRFLSSVAMTDSGVITIGQRAFESCYSLSTIKIPSSVSKIGYGAFRFSSISEIVLPERMKSIEANTFEGCSSMKVLTIPSSIKSIKAAAFAGCSSLETINANPIIAPKTDSEAFANVPTTVVLKIHKRAAGYKNMPWVQWLK